MTPQCGHTGPSGQMRASSHSRALSSSWKIGFDRSHIGLFSLLYRGYRDLDILCQGDNCPFSVAYFFYINNTNWLSVGNNDLNTLFTAGVLCFSTIFIVADLAHRLGYIVERAIDGIQPISYLNLNRGDERAIEQLKKSNHKNLLKGLSGISFAVVTSLFATWLAGYLGISQ